MALALVNLNSPHELLTLVPRLYMGTSQTAKALKRLLRTKNMTLLPHPDRPGMTVNCAVITVSDTRTPETDRSGQLIKQLLQEKGHAIAAYKILKDEPAQIKALLPELCSRPDLDALILNGGTGIAPRDTTYDAIQSLLEKQLPGFGELFRAVSFQEIGSRAIASRACAGVYQSKIIFSIPGSTGAVKLALEHLILPEIVHLVSVISDPYPDASAAIP